MKNVVLLTIDATRKDALGLYGNNKGLTPFLDSLKEDLLIFTDCQSTGPYTQASFPGILTSSYFLDYGQPRGLAQERTLISEPLKDAGFTTAAFHSNPYCSGFFGWNRGWHTFYDSMDDEVEPKIPYIRGNVINEKVSAWLSSQAQKQKDNPFFLWLHYMDVHEPYMPERKYIDMVDPSLEISGDEMYELFQNVILKRDVSDPEKVELLRKLYDIHVREVDFYIEQFFHKLKELDMLDDTIVIFTSDHGDEFNDHGSLSHDDKLYSELIQVPLFIYGLDQKGTCDFLVSTVDIPPTIMNLLGQEPHQNFKGKSLLPVEEYKEEGVFAEAICQKSKRGGNIEKDVYCYRENNLKIICRANLDQWEMYDLSSDPAEQNNIAGESAEFENMKSKLEPMIRRWNK